MPSFRKTATVVAGVALAVGCGSAAAFASSTPTPDMNQTVEMPTDTDFKPGKPVEDLDKGDKPTE